MAELVVSLQNGALNQDFLLDPLRKLPGASRQLQMMRNKQCLGLTSTSIEQGLIYLKKTRQG
jgi:hypothetical protein